MARSIFGTIQKTASGRWRGRYRKNGHTIYTPTMRTKTEVRHLLDQAHAEITLGTWESPTQKKRAMMTFDAWADEWLASLEARQKSVNTIRAHTSSLKVHIRPIVGSLPIKSITPSHAEKVHQAALAKVSPVTAQNVMLCFSSCMSAAVDAKLIADNPVRLRGTRHRYRPMREKIALESAQVDDLLAAAPGKWRLGILLMSFGCLRYGEMAALTTKDIDAERLLVRVSKSVKRDKHGGLVVGEPKSDAAYRTVALPERHRRIVEDHLRLFVGDNPPRALFWRDGWISNDVWNRVIGEAAQAAQLPASLRCHDLRHTGLTLYGRAGATLADLMARAGHSDAATVMIYQHSSARRDRELAEKM